MKPEHFLKNIITDVKVKVTEEFDRNFERKAFFDDKWKDTKHHNPNGSLMNRTGALRRSVQSRMQADGIRFSSSQPYAQIHNEGGQIKVTPQMKKYFWAMYLKNTVKGKEPSPQAMQYKYFALMKVGKVITIRKRQFIGHHPRIDDMVKEIINHNLKEVKFIKTKK